MRLFSQTSAVIAVVVTLVAAARAAPLGHGRSEEIAVVRAGQIWVVDADGSERRRITSPKSPQFKDDQPAWSPDGTQIAFTAWDLYLPQAPSIDAIRVKNREHRSPAIPEYHPVAPSWSHDGSKIAFVANPGSVRGPGTSSLETYGLFVADLRNGKDVQIAPVGLPLDVDGLPKGGYYVNDYAWSPDGGRICLTASREANGIHPAVYLARPSGGALVRLTGRLGAHCVWSSDSRQVAFTDTWNIFAVRVPDGRPRQITHQHAEYEMLPTWSPDSKTIAFLRQERHGPNAPYDLWTTSVASGASHLIARDVSQESWSPDGRLLGYIEGGRPRIDEGPYPLPAPADGLWVANPGGSDKREVVNGANEFAWRPQTR
jgi:Tol biopolymer transport system component